MSDQVENEGCVMCTMGRQVWWLYGYRVAPGAKNGHKYNSAKKHIMGG